MNDAEVRFWAKVDKTGDCWVWTAAQSRAGYGAFFDAGKMVKAHQFSWKLVNGAIPEGLELDHLCRVRNCVRPDHLEPVTHLENVRRALARPTCREGHTREMYGGKLLCRVCTRRRLNAYQNAKRRADGAVAGGPGAAKRAQTSCSHGHAYTEENTGYRTDGYRFCKECQRAQGLARRERERSARTGGGKAGGA